MYLTLAYLIVVFLIIFISGCTGDSRRRNYMLEIESLPMDLHRENSYHHLYKHLDSRETNVIQCPEPETKIIYKYKYKSKKRSKRK